MGSLSRVENLARLRDAALWDVVVIGGGATGLGSAVDAAARGYRTLLLEARDFAQGTSSRSTKLIHGGVRYLAQANLSLVREALHERGLLLLNAPHLVHRRDFVVPAYRWYELPYYGIGLKLYDQMAGRLRLKRSRWLGPSEVVQRVPTIRTAGLRGGVLYTDGQFDDVRFAIALARTLTDLGGTALNHVAVTGLTKRQTGVAGVLARDAETGEELVVPARAVINATGVYVDALRRLDDPGAAPLLKPSQGAHLVLDRSYFPGASALLIPRTEDGRVLFVIPWHERTLIGTTDTPISALPIEPRPLDEEVKYLLSHVAGYFQRPPHSREIRSAFAGLRPLLRGRDGSSTSKLSREHAVVVSGSGLVTITGGKWTTYRRMAIDAVNHAARVGDLPPRPSPTANLKLHGWRESHLDEDEPLSRYGADAAELSSLIAERPEWREPLHPALGILAGEVIWAARHEAARCVEDVLARRTRALLLDARASMEAAPRVAVLLASELGHSQAWQERQVADYRELASGYLALT
jgi:glycerol-3-phosphate dehydrogenase